MVDLQQGRRGALPAIATTIIALMLCVIGASAWLRLAQPRVECAQWPTCRGTTAAEAVRAAQSATSADAQLGVPHLLHIVRVVHRVAATAALLLVVVAVVLLLRQRPRQRELLRPALVLLGLALALSALGVVTPGSRSGAVLLGNLLGGFLMLAMAVALRVRAAQPSSLSSTMSEMQARRACSARWTRWARWAFGLWLLLAALGALSGAGLLYLAAPMHLALAALALPLAAVVGWSARNEAQPTARALGSALLLVVPVQFVLGAAGAANAAGAAWVLLHNASAAAGLALLFGLTALHRDVTPAPPESRR